MTGFEHGRLGKVCPRIIKMLKSRLHMSSIIPSGS